MFFFFAYALLAKTLVKAITVENSQYFEACVLYDNNGRTNVCNRWMEQGHSWSPNPWSTHDHSKQVYLGLCGSLSDIAKLVCLQPLMLVSCKVAVIIHQEDLHNKLIPLDNHSSRPLMSPIGRYGLY